MSGYICMSFAIQIFNTFFLLGDCNFENGKCTWTNMQNIVDDEFDWTRGSGGTASRFTGPTTDHTTNSGKGKPCVGLRV